jgi:hypothetical protein
MTAVALSLALDPHSRANSPSFGWSRGFLFQLSGTKSGPGGFIALAMPIPGHNLLATAPRAQDRQASQALLAAYASPQKMAGLAIGVIACELKASAL